MVVRQCIIELSFHQHLHSHVKMIFHIVGECNYWSVNITNKRKHIMLSFRIKTPTYVNSSKCPGKSWWRHTWTSGGYVEPFWWISWADGCWRCDDPEGLINIGSKSDDWGKSVCCGRPIDVSRQSQQSTALHMGTTLNPAWCTLIGQKAARSFPSMLRVLVLEMTQAMPGIQFKWTQTKQV